MANTIQILGVKALATKLNGRKLEAKRASRAAVRVGFTANYAVFVHEIDKNYNNGKRWKFLERPTRMLLNTGELSRIISTAYKGGASLEQSLYLAGLRIQREAMKESPIDTGNLKGSAFTRKGKT